MPLNFDGLNLLIQIHYSGYLCNRCMYVSETVLVTLPQFLSKEAVQKMSY